MQRTYNMYLILKILKKNKNKTKKRKIIKHTFKNCLPIKFIIKTKTKQKKKKKTKKIPKFKTH